MARIYSAVLAVAVILTVAGWSCRHTNNSPDQIKAAEASRDLRKMFLELTPEEAGITIPAGQRVWGGAMDLAIGNATATVTSLMDGTASIYISSGGGVIGGGGHESVSKAAKALVESLEICASDFRSGPIQDLPSTNQSRFYALSRSGLLHSEEVSTDDLEGMNHPLSSCYVAAQEVLTQLRLVSEENGQP